MIERINVDTRRAGILCDYFMEGIRRKLGTDPRWDGEKWVIGVSAEELKATILEIVGECNPTISGIVVEVDRENGRTNVLIPISKEMKL